MAILDDIEAEIANQDTVEGSVEQLVANLVAQLDSAGQDPTRLQAVLQALRNNDTRLAALVVQNTPAPTVSIPPPKHA